MSDLDVFDFDVVDDVWDCMKENELKEWVDWYKAGMFKPISIIPSDMTGYERDQLSYTCIGSVKSE